MRNRLENKKTAMIVVVESSAPVRSMLVEAVHSLGYERIQSTSNCKEALHILEVESIDWLIMPLMAIEEVNGIHILKQISINPGLRHTHTTLLIDAERETYCLPLAFELGLLSWHPRPNMKDMFLGSMQELFRVWEEQAWDRTLTAAHYLRTHLKEKKLLKSLVAFERTLLSMYPGKVEQLLYLAEAEHLATGSARASGLLRQAQLIDENHPLCKQAADLFGDLDAAGSDEKVAESAIGIKSAAVIDPDTDVLRSISEHLQQIGVEKVECFEDGIKAFKWLKANSKVDLILMEWRIPSISGPVLIQKIRNAVSAQVPIIVVSSQIKRQERPLLSEMGVDDIVEKPFGRSEFYASVISSVQQHRAPTQQKSLERKIRRLLAASQISDAQRLIAQFLASKSIKEGAKKEMEAEFEFARGNFETAFQLSTEALKLGGGDSLTLLNLTGKCMLKLKRHEGALRCFERVNSISSMNIDCLLNLGEVHLHLNRDDSAKAAIDAALELDPDEQRAIELDSQHALKVGDKARAAAQFRKLESVSRVISYINNRAVSLTLANRFAEGIELYRRAIDALPPEREEAKAIISYNLGLCHARNSQYQEALVIILESCVNPRFPIARKAKALSQRLQQAMATGTPIFKTEADKKDEELFETFGQKASSTSKKVAIDWKELLVKIEARRGDIGCYLTFYSLEDLDPKAAKLLDNLPHFASRATIGR